jgi:hypothetical protein
MPVPRIAGAVGFLERAGEPPVRAVELAADVDERVAHLQRVRGDQHRLEQEVRRELEDPAVLERARLAFVGVRAQVVRLAVVRVDDRPLATHRKRGAAAALDSGGRDLGDDVLRRHLLERLLERRVAAARAVFRQRVRRGRDGEVMSNGDSRHLGTAFSSASTLSGVMLS